MIGNFVPDLLLIVLIRAQRSITYFIIKSTKLMRLQFELKVTNCINRQACYECLVKITH